MKGKDLNRVNRQHMLNKANNKQSNVQKHSYPRQEERE